MSMSEKTTIFRNKKDEEVRLLRRAPFPKAL
jgi:hypothetical protein